MAAKGCERLLPLPCGPGKHRPVECLRATSAATVVAHSPPPQSTTRRVGSVPPDLHAVAASSTCSASLSYSSFSRHSSKAGAVCVKAPVRICAGGRSVMIVPTASVVSVRRKEAFSMTECSETLFPFEAHFSRQVVAKKEQQRTGQPARVFTEFF